MNKFCVPRGTINHPPKRPPEKAPKNWKLEKIPNEVPLNSSLAKTDNLAGREASKKLKPAKKIVKLANTITWE